MNLRKKYCEVLIKNNFGYLASKIVKTLNSKEKKELFHIENTFFYQKKNKTN